MAKTYYSDYVDACGDRFFMKRDEILEKTCTLVMKQIPVDDLKKFHFQNNPAACAKVLTPFVEHLFKLMPLVLSILLPSVQPEEEDHQHTTVKSLNAHRLVAHRLVDLRENQLVDLRENTLHDAPITLGSNRSKNL